jgi:hypothetical protein
MSLYGDFTTNYLVSNLGGIRLLQLRAHHLDRMYANIAVGRRGRPLSPSTIRQIHTVLPSALNTAVKRQLLPYSPANHIELAPENPKRPKPWTLEECQTMLGRHKEMQVVERTAWGPAWNDAGLVLTREDGRPLRPQQPPGTSRRWPSSQVCHSATWP